jgi:hypothetical protein
MLTYMTVSENMYIKWDVVLPCKQEFSFISLTCAIAHVHAHTHAHIPIYICMLYPVIKFLPHTLQHLAVDSGNCLHDPSSQLW